MLTGVCCCRPGGLAYVVAFANRGAKDVTQRYTGSVLAADKLRDNTWWEQTLKTLRKHEVSFLHPQSLNRGESMPFNHHSMSLLKQQPRAKTIECSDVNVC